MVISAQLAEESTTGVVRYGGQLPKECEIDFAHLAKVNPSSVLRFGGHLPKALLRKFANLAQETHSALSTPVEPKLGQDGAPLKAMRVLH